MKGRYSRTWCIHFPCSFLFDDWVNSLEQLSAECKAMPDAVGTAQSRAGGLAVLAGV